MSQFTRDFKQGLREGPLVFFAPVIAFWRLIGTTTDQLVRDSRRSEDRSKSAPRPTHH